MAERKKMIRYHVQNVKAAFKNENGEWDTPFSIGFADRLALQPDYNEVKFYGDGIIIAILADDKGKTGTITIVAIEDEYEFKCGRKMEVDGGIAKINQISSVPHCIYFENILFLDGIRTIEKNWLINCTSGQSEETFEQTKDDPTVNYLEIPINVMGTFLLDSTGNANFVDENGNERMSTQFIKKPTDVGYATFGDAVPVIKAKAVTP